MSLTSVVNFNYLMAFFLPGFLGTYSLRYVSRYIDSLFRTVQSENTSLGAAVILALFALIMGFILNAIRGFILDFIYYKSFNCEEIDYARLNKDNLPVFQEAIDNNYRFYQFYANTYVAMLIFLVLRYFVAAVSILNDLTIFSISVVTAIILFFESRILLKETHIVISKILKKEVAS